MKLAFAVVVLAAGCAAAPSKPTAKDGWATLSYVDKHEVMTFTVLPNMGRAFQQFSGKKEARLRCTSCHGKDGEALQYKMPNGIHPLDPANLPGLDDGPMPRFMIEQVVPAMKEMTGDANITCFSCHGKRS